MPLRYNNKNNMIIMWWPDPDEKMHQYSVVIKTQWDLLHEDQMSINRIETKHP
jgi:hypothetical protein